MKTINLKGIYIFVLGVCSSLATNAQSEATTSKITDKKGNQLTNGYYRINNNRSTPMIAYRKSNGDYVGAKAATSVLDSTSVWKFKIQDNQKDIQIFSPDDTSFLTWRGSSFTTGKSTIGIASINSTKPKNWRLYTLSAIETNHKRFAMKLENKHYFSQFGGNDNKYDMGFYDLAPLTDNGTRIQFTRVYRIDFNHYATKSGISITQPYFIAKIGNEKSNCLFVENGSTDIKNLTFALIADNMPVTNLNGISFHITYADKSEADVKSVAAFATIVSKATQDMTVSTTMPSPYSVTKNFLDRDNNVLSSAIVDNTYGSYPLPDAPNIDGYTLAIKPTIASPITQDTAINYIYDKLPFKVSRNIPEGASTFPDDTHWYRLTLNKMYWVYNTDSNNVKAQTKIYGTMLDFTDEKALWCITGNDANGYKIYNKAAGASKVLIPSNKATDNETPLALNTPSASTGTWYFQNNNNTWDIFEKNNKLNFINNRNGYVGIWTNTAAAGDEGSAVTFTTIQQMAKKTLPYLRRGVFGYASEDLAEYKAAANATEFSLNNLLSAISALKLKTPIGISTEKFYEISNVYNPTQNASINENHKSATYTVNTPNLIWRFIPVPNEDGVYYLHSDGAYLSNIGLYGFAIPTTEIASAGKFVIESLDYCRCGIKCINPIGIETDKQYLHNSENNDLVGWLADKNYNSYWYIKEVGAASAANSSVVTGFTKEVPYASRCFPYNSIVPNNTTAYFGTIEDKRLKLHTYATEGQIINANTAVILLAKNLEKENTTLLLEPTNTNNTNVPIGIEQNVLIGTPKFGMPKDSIEKFGNYAYVLAAKGTPFHVGFYKFIGNTIPAFRAYFTLPQAIKASALSFDFSENITTAIQGIINVQDKKKNYIFDINGKRVTNPTKGIYIQNNHKLIIK